MDMRADNLCVLLIQNFTPSNEPDQGNELDIGASKGASARAKCRLDRWLSAARMPTVAQRVCVCSKRAADSMRINRRRASRWRSACS